jgi:putative protease
MGKLLAPAGNLEKLKWVVEYGADEVYFGTKQFSLRNYAGNFSFEEAEEGLDYLHKKGKKGFVTLNIYPFSNEYDEIIKTAHILEECKIDAFIVSDLGILNELKKAGIKTKIHISTQANTLSYQTIKAYKELGASRVNLARELSLQQIEFIQQNLKNTQIETEVFIHGAVCFSYSGRCAISDYMTGRRANRGECTQPCRWKYNLVEEKRPGEYYPVEEDSRGLYFFNSKDLALFPFVHSLDKAGVTSFKIEGRMKSIHYLASTVSLYRRVLNGEKISEELGFKLLSKVKNRGYSSGFMKGKILPEDYQIKGGGSNSSSEFLGNVILNKNKTSKIEVRNKITANTTVEILTPKGKIFNIKLPTELMLENGKYTTVANHQQFIILNKEIPPYSIIRTII